MTPIGRMLIALTFIIVIMAAFMAGSYIGRKIAEERQSAPLEVVVTNTNTDQAAIFILKSGGKGEWDGIEVEVR